MGFGLDPVQVEGAKGPVEEGAAGFGGDALAPSGGGEGVAEFGVAVGWVPVDDLAFAEECAVGLAFDGELGAGAFLFHALADGDEIVGLRRLGVGREIHVAHHDGVAMERKNGGGVGWGEGAQAQAGGLEGGQT